MAYVNFPLFYICYLFAGVFHSNALLKSAKQFQVFRCLHCFYMGPSAVSFKAHKQLFFKLNCFVLLSFTSLKNVNKYN